jgi:hypothetical protein
MTDATRFRTAVERLCRRLGHPRMSWYERRGEAEEGPVHFVARSCPCGAYLDVSTLAREIVATPQPVEPWR